MKLTDEQQRQLKRMRRSFLLKGMLISSLYFSSLFISNFILVLLDVYYVHDKSFVFYSVVATTIVIMLGWRFNLEEVYLNHCDKVKKFLKLE
jgi:hypothetical protein